MRRAARLSLVVRRHYKDSNLMSFELFKIILKHSICAQFLVAYTVHAMPAAADSSSPRLAAYYDSFLTICGNKVYEWSNNDTPREKMMGAKQVGIGKYNRYALTIDDKLLVWGEDRQELTILMDDVSSFYAGRTGLLAIRNDNSLWRISTKSLLEFGEAISGKPFHVANSTLTAAVGDGANYYVTQEGDLYVQGRAHRGQFGNGKLTSSDTFIQSSSDVVQVVSHTGHALVLKKDGGVWGTGGNIYGPLGNHGYGDKAVEWGLIMEGASAIATGSSHSLAIKPDRSLWIWGRNEGLDPKQVISEVAAVAAGNKSTIALSNDILWQWDIGANPRMIMKCY